jgi:hypothetical protein
MMNPRVKRVKPNSDDTLTLTFTNKSSVKKFFRESKPCNTP